MARKWLLHTYKPQKYYNYCQNNHYKLKLTNFIPINPIFSNNYDFTFIIQLFLKNNNYRRLT